MVGYHHYSYYHHHYLAAAAASANLSPAFIFPLAVNNTRGVYVPIFHWTLGQRTPTGLLGRSGYLAYFLLLRYALPGWIIDYCRRCAYATRRFILVSDRIVYIAPCDIVAILAHQIMLRRIPCGRCEH